MSDVAMAILFICLALRACPVSAQTPATALQERPNILFIVIDDLRPALGCYGDPLAKSPNIDQFATSARRFNHAYVQQAVCGPSRTSLLTGRLPDHTKVWHNRNRFRETLPDLVTLPQLFKRNGYRALSLGKIFSGNEKELDPLSWSAPELLRGKGWKKYIQPENQGSGSKQAAYENPAAADDAYPDGKLANLVVKTLKELKQDGQPFFLAVGFFKPHLPFNAPKKYWNLYEPSEFELPANLCRPVELVPELARHSHRELGGYKSVPKNEELDKEQSDLLRHGYYACVSYVDAQVGKVIDTLRQLDLDRNTIVVLLGDHGFALGETNRWCKGTNFELDTRVPLLIRVPDLDRPGIATDSLVELVDVYPTIAALARIQAPADLDGRSFASLLRDPYAPGSDAVLSQFNRPWDSTTPEVMGYSVRTKDVRYTRWIRWQTRETISEELYDYSSPQSARLFTGHLIENRNIVNNQPDLLDLMRNRMDDMMASRIETRKR